MSWPMPAPTPSRRSSSSSWNFANEACWTRFAPMGKRVELLVGTKKGAFILESDESRKKWDMRGPFCENWPTHHLVRSTDGSTLYAGGGSAWYGPSVWRSTDDGATWTQSSE